MAQIFSQQIITQDGLALAAQATASNPIQYVGALSNATIPSDPTDKTDYTGRAGQIDAASATNNVARIVAAFLNALDDNPQNIKAIAILGKLASQADTDAVIVAYAADNNSTIILPRSSAPEQVMRFAFNLPFNAGTVVSTFQTGDATLEDLDRLVSCHKAGQPTVGAAQTIYGEKTFDDTIRCGWIQANGASSSYQLMLAGGKTDVQGVMVGWDSTNSIDCVAIGGSGGAWVVQSSAIYPDAANSTVGTPSKKVGTVYASNIGTNSNFVAHIYATAIGAPTYKTENIYAKKVGTIAFPCETVAATNVYADPAGGFHGVRPYPTYDATEPTYKVHLDLGAIAFVYLHYDWQTRLHAGETFEVGHAGTHWTLLEEAVWKDGVGWTRGDAIYPYFEQQDEREYYTWKAITGIDSNDATDSYSLILVMRMG